jgi:ABC-2 type transport system ATP-binding protein
MDEPTVGIDPQSRNLIYELVESLKKQGITILYTTHYMEEAERLCSRISIIDLGKIIVTGTLSELIEIVGTLDRIQIDLRGKSLSNAFDNMFGDVQVDFDGSRLTLKTHHGRERLPEIMRKIGDFGFEITSATVFTPNLETVFLHLTGKELRD